MRRKTLRLLCGSLCLFSLLSPAWAEGFKLPSEKRPWIEAKTAHFRFTSEVTEKETKQLALGFETLRSVMLNLRPDIQWHKMNLEAEDPFDIFIFRSKSSFEPFSPNKQFQGFFRTGRSGYKIAFSPDIQDPTQIVYHEFVHYVMAKNYRQIPNWLNEGLAEYFSTMEIVDGEARVGRPIQHAVLSLLQNRPLRLADLLNTELIDIAPTDSRHFQRFYATSWLLIHYFLGGDPQRHAQFQQFFQFLEAGMAPAQAFAQAVPIPLEKLDLALAAHLRDVVRRYWYWKIPMREEKEVTDFSSQPLPYPAVLGRLALLAQDSPEPPAWVDQLVDTAMAKDPRCPEAQVAKGTRLILTGKAEAGAEALLAGLEAERDPWQIRNTIRTILGSQDSFSLSYGQPLPPLLARVRDLLKIAMERQPDDPWILELFADISAASPENHQEALEKLQAAFQRHPDRIPLLDKKFRLLLVKDTTEARHFVETIETRKDPALVAWAKEIREEYPPLFGRTESRSSGQRPSLAPPSMAAAKDTIDKLFWERAQKAVPPGPAGEKVLAALKDAEQLFGQKACGEALARLAAVEKEGIEPQVGAVFSELRTINILGISKWSLETYNQAVTMGNDGDRAQAVTLLEQVAQLSTIERIREKAKALLMKWKPAPPPSSISPGIPEGPPFVSAVPFR